MLGRRAVKFLKFCRPCLRSKLPELLSRKALSGIGEIGHSLHHFDTLLASVFCIFEFTMPGYEHQPKVSFQNILGTQHLHMAGIRDVNENILLVYEQ